jgi:rhodanese-related sulfurtransferase
MIKTVSAQVLHEWLSRGEAVLIDVREPAEYEAQHIPGAVPLPLASVSKNKLPANGGKKIVMQCGSGKRSGMACQKLQAEAADMEAYNLEGGIGAWIRAGYATERAGQ